MSNYNNRDSKKSAPASPREVDTAIHDSLTRIKNRWILINRRKIATWQGLLIILFLSGFVSALLWAGYRNLYTDIFGKPGDIISNIAQVIYEDSTGNNYGPTASKPVVITEVANPSKVISVTAKFPKGFLNSKVKVQIKDKASEEMLKEITAVLDSNNELTVPADLLIGNYIIMMVTPWHLSKKLDVSLSQPEVLLVVSESDLKPGNLADTDDIINAADWDIMRGQWGSIAAPEVDLNQDGLVNTLDWSLMKKNWRVKGDCPDMSETECRNRN